MVFFTSLMLKVQFIYFFLKKYSEFVNYDYEDLNSASFYANMSECYTRCVLDVQCKSISWNKLTNNCLLRLKTNVMKKCEFNTLCMTVPGKYVSNMHELILIFIDYL